jgi:NAD(P)-dependent dehydrogenase (short-subunit alcohol dehydrogenase family)
MINNAGFLSSSMLDQLEMTQLQHQFRTHAFGPILLVKALHPNLRKASEQNSCAKVVQISSKLGSMAVADKASEQQPGYYGYSGSKAALNMMSKYAASELISEGIVVCCVNPGYVATDLTGFEGDMDADDSVKEMARVINGLTLEHSGCFKNYNGEAIPW